MLIKACFKCGFHKIKQGDEAKMSYCSKEGCWAQYSKCLSLKALSRFLGKESVSPKHSFTS